jgi:hypothetical protein
MVPHLKIKFVNDELDRTSIENRITTRLMGVGVELPVGPLELRIAYKLYLSAQKDFEDAVHLYTLFEETLSTSKLEKWVREARCRRRV